MSKPAPVSTLLQNRGALLQVLVAAVFLALGVNLLSTAITDAIESKTALWGLSLLLLALSAFFVLRQMIPSRRTHQTMSGFLVFHAENNELIKVPRYEYSEKISGFVEGLFAENSAPKRLWDADPVHKAFELDAQTGTMRFRQTEAGQLIVEATEYYVLDALSTHLTDYFNQSGLDSAQLQEFSREDVPDILFRNRFLDTFSRPMRERAVFSNDSTDSAKFGDIYSLHGPNGVHFSKFDLILPTGAKVQRLSQNSILITTSKFKLTFSIEFDGLGANLPHKFSELYLDGLSYSDVRTYGVQLITSIEFSRWALLSRSGWDYHVWLDSFLENLTNQSDSDVFLKGIQWEAAVTVARVVNERLRRKKVAGVKVSENSSCE